MGQYICIGLACSIHTNFNSQTMGTLKHFSQFVGKQLNIDISQYTIENNPKGSTVFNLNDSWCGEPFVQLIEKQVEMSDLFTLAESTAQKFRAIDTFKKLQSYLKKEQPNYIQMIRIRPDSICLNNAHEIDITVEMISFVLAGKILYEGGDELFRYFEKNIHQQEHPLAKCMKVSIVG